MLLDDQTLFKDETVFTPNYTPEDFLHRDSQLKELSYCLKPGLRGVKPVNALINGPPGTGKTTAVKHMFNQVRETSNKLVTVYINCEDYSTPYKIFSRIYERVYNASPPSTGKPLEDLKDRVFHRLAKQDQSMVVCLDELDRLFIDKTVDRVLVDLLKSYTTYDYDRVGVVGVMIDPSFIADLDPKTRSIYNPVRIEFPPYNKQEIRDILLTRIKQGLYADVVPNQILDRITDHTLRGGSDVRLGLDLLYRSGLIAEQDSSKKITSNHLSKALEALENPRTEHKKHKITEEEQTLLDIILNSENKTSGSIQHQLREKTGIGVKKYNQMIKKLENDGLIKTEYLTEQKGRTRKIELAP